MNERPERATALAPVDGRRRALEIRIQAARERLSADLRRASTMVRSVAVRTRRGLLRAVLVGGVLAIGIGVALFRHFRKPRIRVVWRR